ncbi:bifunctional diaminohydroxyphosphoribosylaminopyrimidine deaminase/5-amino-6-(5-phosphoribosylamino)uracil reductase RibD [Peptoniphilus indolicus]|nr:bifunctional diaminohydroxyphosphoribosylaminopyrimidine deaminase/5-amino-6-(5-phosphoribosylamino)uracil reductase RibD [Peptoniphilus indolicus]
MLSEEDKFMKRALELAELGRGFTKTNPLVGAVVVKNNKIIAEGYHHRFGDNHAEVDALNKVSKMAEGATMYVTLEPCSHYGKTPPCVDRIIKEKLKRVVVAIKDPDERVSGRGIEILKKEGIDVEVGMLEEEAKFQNRVFLLNKSKKRPFITLKFATTLDGKIATSSGESKWITNSTSRKDSHILRGKVDGILVGKNTASKDNPFLTNRSGEGDNPIRILLDSELEINSNYNIYNSEAKTIVFTSSSDFEKREKLIESCEVVRVSRDEKGLNLNEICDELLKRDIAHILVEGGSEVHSSFIRAGLVDEIYHYIAPKLLGGGKSVDDGEGILNLSDSLNFNIISTKNLDGDILIHGVRDVYGDS